YSNCRIEAIRNALDRVLPTRYRTPRLTAASQAIWPVAAVLFLRRPAHAGHAHVGFGPDPDHVDLHRLLPLLRPLVRPSPRARQQRTAVLRAMLSDLSAGPGVLSHGKLPRWPGSVAACLQRPRRWLPLNAT